MIEENLMSYITKDRGWVNKKGRLPKSARIQVLFSDGRVCTVETDYYGVASIVGGKGLRTDGIIMYRQASWMYKDRLEHTQNRFCFPACLITECPKWVEIAAKDRYHQSVLALARIAKSHLSAEDFKIIYPNLDITTI